MYSPSILLSLLCLYFWQWLLLVLYIFSNWELSLNQAPYNVLLCYRSLWLNVCIYHVAAIFVGFPIHSGTDIYYFSIDEEEQDYFPFQPQFGSIALNGRKTIWLHHDKSTCMYLQVYIYKCTMIV